MASTTRAEPGLVARVLPRPFYNVSGGGAQAGPVCCAPGHGVGGRRLPPVFAGVVENTVAVAGQQY